LVNFLTGHRHAYPHWQKCLPPCLCPGYLMVHFTLHWCWWSCPFSGGCVDGQLAMAVAVAAVAGLAVVSGAWGGASALLVPLGAAFDAFAAPHPPFEVSH
jgi:hypothetical protein